MKTITLSQGYFALVDDADFEKVKHLSWYVTKRKNGRFYAMTSIEGKTVYLHRYILRVRNRNIEVDHKDRNGLDCRRENLRECSRSQNMANARKFAGQSKSSHLKGVTWDKERSKWMAKIMVGHKTINLGRFSSELDAARSYDSAATKHFGSFARLNGAI